MEKTEKSERNKSDARLQSVVRLRHSIHGERDYGKLQNKTSSSVDVGCNSIIVVFFLKA